MGNLIHDPRAPRPSLYCHQQAMRSAVAGRIEDGGKALLVVMATGSGKTIAGGTVARDLVECWGQPVLWLAHRDSLVKQAVRDLAVCGLSAEVEQGKKTALRGLIDQPAAVVATVQTLGNPDRLRQYPADYFGSIVIDEAHHATPRGDGGHSLYTRIVSHFKGHRALLGLTATPDRADGKDLIGGVFQEIVFRYEIDQAIRDGALVELVVEPIETDIDLSALSTRGKKDFTDRDLEAVMAPEVEAMANLLADRLQGRSAIVFTPGVKSAQAFASALRHLGVPSEAVWGGEDCEQDLIFARSKAWRYGGDDRIQVLCNCQIATEGVDMPWLEIVHIARPTKSRALYSQMTGRGLRRCPDIGKKECLLIDNAYVSGRHDLITPADILSSSVGDPEVYRMTKAILGSGGNLLDAVERAAEKVRQLREEEERRRQEEERRRTRQLEVKARKRQVAHTSHTYKPFEANAEAAGLVLPEAPPGAYRKVTPRQLAALHRFGVKEAHDGWPFLKASKVMDWCVARAEAGRATLAQVNAVVRVTGIDRKEALRLSIREAHEILDRVFSRAG